MRDFERIQFPEDENYRGKVLIVDDEPDVLMSLKHQLRREFEVETATSGPEALEILAGEPVDVIISDQRMPGMKGSEFLVAARALRPFCTRIMLTGYADLEAVIAAVNEAKIYNYVTKPWDIDQIRSLVRNALAHTQLRVKNQLYVEALKLAKHAAESANRAKTDFLGNLSHEIRTPLNHIIGMATLLGNTDIDDQQTHQVETILEQAEKLNAMLASLLEFAHEEKDFDKAEPELFNLDDLVRNIALLHAKQARTKGLELVVDAPPSPCVFFGPGSQIAIVLKTLLENAIKFTSQGKVTVSANIAETDKEHPNVHIHVIDTGPGIAEEDRERIFKMFEQGDASLTREHGGPGIGLAIADRLVKQMGSELRLESVPGEGSRFHFAVKLEAREPARQPSVFELDP